MISDICLLLGGLANKKTFSDMPVLQPSNRKLLTRHKSYWLSTLSTKCDAWIPAATAVPTSRHLCCLLTLERTLSKSRIRFWNTFTEGEWCEHFSCTAWLVAGTVCSKIKVTSWRQQARAQALLNKNPFFFWYDKIACFCKMKWYNFCLTHTFTN